MIANTEWDEEDCDEYQKWVGHWGRVLCPKGWQDWISGKVNWVGSNKRQDL